MSIFYSKVNLNNNMLNCSNSEGELSNRAIWVKAPFSGGIHDYHNGGSHSRAGVSCMETRSIGPERRVALSIR